MKDLTEGGPCGIPLFALALGWFDYDIRLGQIITVALGDCNKGSRGIINHGSIRIFFSPTRHISHLVSTCHH